MPLTRVAPTPSGFLHEGNRANFRAVAQLATRVGAQIALRIDDADATRYRPAYVEDIFRTLHAMEVRWDIGPSDLGDFEANWSQRSKTDYYRAELVRLRASMATYACDCSRAVQVGPATGGCVGGCRTRDVPLVPGESALRVAVPIGPPVHVGQLEVDLAAEMGDFIVWRRDDLPAYQLVSVVEDRDLGTTHIVRGRDLLASSAAQIFLADSIGASNVAAATYVHHELITDSDGRKLSKTQISRE
jgi:glutamyl/glutaminyl-tRNA synthetase